jgi:quinoprotein glucose dehydrogenase
MTVFRRHRPSSLGAGRRWSSRFVFSIVTTGLFAIVGVCVVLAARSDKWWWDNLGGPDSANFMNLDQINKTNVSQLEVAWFYPYAATGFNPIVVDDVMYTMGRGNALVALDASTGKEIWIHEDMGGMVGRGINYWESEDGKDKRLITSIDSYLQEIDARTGKSILTFGIDGTVNLRDGLLRAEGTALRVQSGSPGKVWKNEIILGSAPGEAYVLPPGDIRAYDVITGKKLWQFHTVPWPGEYGYDTRPKDNWKYAGGTNNWGSLSVDDARGIVYIPTGSSNYDFYGADRVGQDLFANCILALDARTGKRLWHFQTVHHDMWDLDNVSAPQLVTVMHNGQKVDAVAHAGKTGFLYVLNRVTGEPLWPIEERPVMQTDVPGEKSWPTQPFPTKPPPFARQSFTVDDVNPWLAPSPEAYQAMKERVAKMKNGTGPQGGIFVPAGIGYDTISMPGNQGGSNWGTTAADPQKGMVFVVGVNQVAFLQLYDVTKRGAGAGRFGAGGGPLNPNLQQGLAAFQNNCQVCHGADLLGVLPGTPSLVGVTDRMGEDAIKAIVTGGRGQMRPVSSITEVELNAVIGYLGTFGAAGRRGGGGRGRGGPAGTFPPGPVVAAGGAPHPPLPTRGPGPVYPGNGGNAGNNAYPEDVTEVPPVRYMSDYGVMASWTKPPYTTLTAYDLNSGEIKWQVGNGDDLRTMAAGGPAGTGGLAARNGVIVTKSGLVFLAGNDNKVRAYDEDTGKVLWTGTFAGGTSGVPVMYESKGRQFFVMSAPIGGGRRGGGGPPPAANPADVNAAPALAGPAAAAGRAGGRGAAPAAPIDPNAPVGAIAFALPVKK